MSKFFTVGSLLLGLSLILVVLSYQAYGSRSRYQELIGILEQKDSLIQDGYNDMMLQTLQQLRENDIELAKSQGRIEGMIAVAANLPPESNQTSGIWHAGYMRGMEQEKYAADALKKASEPLLEYKKGNKNNRKSINGRN